MRINYASEIVRLVPMRDVAELYGLRVNRSGFTVCPFHGEQKPSLKIYDGDRGFHCFGCGKGGNVIDFVMDYLGLNFMAACERLNDDFRLGLPIGKKLDLRAKKKAVAASRERQEQIKRQKTERDAIYDAYYHTLDVWCACDYLLIHAPVMSTAWALAVRYRDTALYNLDCAEGRLYAYEQTRNANCDTNMDKGRLQHSKAV